MLIKSQDLYKIMISPKTVNVYECDKCGAVYWFSKKDREEDIAKKCNYCKNKRIKNEQ